MKRDYPQMEALKEACEAASANTMFIYKPTYDLITKAIDWSFGKTEEEIRKRIIVCEGKQHKGRAILRPQWQLIIDTLKWLIFECEIDPLESRRNIIPGAR